MNPEGRWAGKGIEGNTAHSWWPVVGPASGKETVIKGLSVGPKEEKVFGFCLGLTFYFCAKDGEGIPLL